MDAPPDQHGYPKQMYEYSLEKGRLSIIFALSKVDPAILFAASNHGH